MKQTFLVVTSIADQSHPILNLLAQESLKHQTSFVVVGDTKSPDAFQLEGCDFYSIERQLTLPFDLAKTLPHRHYARKNLGYLVALSQGAEIIIETDDDNIPTSGFWDIRRRQMLAYPLNEQGWVNVFRHFSDLHIWPRGFALQKVQEKMPELQNLTLVECPIQQGMADDNPDVDAIYRLVLPLPVRFKEVEPLALGQDAICPFNSQNTTWFREAFPLMYLPSYCSFRMTDIWRSFVAQRIAWTCGWSILFHQSTVRQERNDHDLMNDFLDEIPGYRNNLQLFEALQGLDLKMGTAHISENMKIAYRKLIDMGVVGQEEMPLLESWLNDIQTIQGKFDRL